MTNADNHQLHGGQSKSRGYRRLAGAALAFLIAAFLTVETQHAAQAQRIRSRTRVCQVTGNELEETAFPYLHNQQRSIDALVYGTDLGTSFTGYNGSSKRVRFFFGDTFGYDLPYDPSFNPWNLRSIDGWPHWRPNIMADTGDMDASNCINLYYKTGGSGVGAKPMFVPPEGWILAYPTTGWYDPNTRREYVSVSYISEDWWPAAVIHYSDDSWATAPKISSFSFLGFAGDNFQGLYTLHYGDYFYFYGGRASRDGAIYVARIRVADMTKMANGQKLPQIYTKCNRFEDFPPTCGDPKPIVPAPAGDFSVMYYPYLDDEYKFVMLYLNMTLLRIDIRWARNPEGPWQYSGRYSSHRVAVNCSHCGVYSNCYSPMLLHEHSSPQRSSNKEIYFLMSRMTPADSALYNSCSPEGCSCDSTYWCPTWPYCLCDPVNIPCNQVYNAFLMKLTFY